MVYSGWATELDEDQSQLRRMNGYSRRDMETVNNKNAEKNTKQNNYYHATPAPPTSVYSSDFQSCELEFSSPSTHTNTSRPKDMSAAQNGKTGNYHGPTAAHGTSVHPGAFPSGGMGSIANRNTPTGFPARTEYPSTLQSGRTESSSIIPNANTGNSVVNMNAARNGKTKQYHQDTAVPPISRYSKDLQSSELHSRSTPAQTNSMTNANNIDRSKKGGELSYPRTAATSVIVGYPSSVQPGRIDSSSTPDHTNTAKVNRPTKGKEAATAVARYSDDLYSKEIDSNSTPAYTNTGANANKVSRSKKEKEGNYPSPATMSATAGYPSEFQSGESDWSYTAGNEIHTTNNTNKKNPSKIGKNSKHGTEHSITEAPPCAGYPSTFRGRENDSSSTVTKNSMSKGKNGNYTSTTVGSAGQGYPSTFQSSNIKSSANTSAWEEHIDEHTNRKYFYNCITGRSSWGEPNASVKRAPPPPPSPPPTSLIVEKREQDHWFRTRNSRGTKVWYNDVTNRTQVDRPDCLRKYR